MVLNQYIYNFHNHQLQMGVYLAQPILNKDTHQQQIGNIKYTSSEMQGWRKNMEDAKISQLNVISNGKSYHIFGVFDGHGGTQVSKFVESKFVQEFLATNSLKKGDIKQALIQTFKRMDQLLDSSESQKELRNIRKKYGNNNHHEDDDNIHHLVGCTANVVVIDDNFYYCANAGDSRAVLCRGGRAIALSEDHKPENKTQIDRIQNAGGKIFNGRVNGGLNLTRALGDFQYKNQKNLEYHQQMITCHPDILVQKRQKNDEFIIMGCDGIWQKYVTNNQGLIDLLSAERKKQKQSRVIVENLLDFLVAKHTSQEVGCDNMTLILIEIFN